MESQERFDAAAEKLDELKAKMEEAKTAVKDSIKDGVANFRSDMEFTSSCIDEIYDDAEKRHDQKIEENIDRIIAAEEKHEEKKEERREALRAKIKSLQDKINDLSWEYAKADQEELILDLLAYADECHEIAVYMAEEAIFAYKEAAEQIEIYKEKYGE